jgi:hypothetical protein
MTEPRAEDEGRMTDNDEPDRHRNFDAPAVLRKWPSLNNQRLTEATGPYMVCEGTLGECLREFMAKPAPTRHLYEIHTSPQPPLVADVLSGEPLAEFARLREFL